ncbi:hypothetical protein B0T24DRAFT_617244 [Lasiosphaeria ovina]|uniref:UBC core domain-containing protein n=1 Tax=Lasiosphaeria ovina TaxID=92902 RepID=A0AAE0KHF5_9PEZI|nr:hypothetical protein B0T24DRAFT_617244 [Lasiosphaeria ovina]
MHTELRGRLLRDIAELKLEPYPNIALHVRDDNMDEACLVLTPEGWIPLHLTVIFTNRYPLDPPIVRMDSSVRHPNVFQAYICASILNTTEGYTPAYTLKGIAIQLLSFFSSASIDQEHGMTVSLDWYRTQSSEESQRTPFACDRCGFSSQSSEPSSAHVPSARSPLARMTTIARPEECFIDGLPNELLLQVVESLEFKDLVSFSSAWPRLSQLITAYDVLRTREMQCFVLKENYLTTKLGVGVSGGGRGVRAKLQSEFDLLSQKAYKTLHVRSSVHNISFTHWLPLPISPGHWRRVEADVLGSLQTISQFARTGTSATVMYAFMNDIVVRLNADLERSNDVRGYSHKSTLRHASEKAIESYFHLFHLLLCLATSPTGPAEFRDIVRDANRMIRSFMSGKTGKADHPNLGYLLIALLISDIDPTEELMKAIVVETITRNVVWLLDSRGAGMAELAYLEPDRVCEYRLKKTFEGSRTSYRLLMFSELFRRAARPSISPPSPTGATAAKSSGSTKKSLSELRDELFTRHGGAPFGTAAHMAAEVRRLQQIDDFPSFLKEMGVAIPTQARFTEVLRSCVQASMDRGYSKYGASMAAFASLRLVRDRSIDPAAVVADMMARGITERPLPQRVELDISAGLISFFISKDKRGNGRARPGRA